jgi:hypothetical protein
MENEQQLQQLITLFLEINPNPSDQQFHMLADSIGVDHEALEAVSYAMLAKDGPQQSVMSGTEDLSESQKVLDGDYDPNVTSPDDLLLNDGAPEGTSNIQELQDDLYDDGVAADDIGLGVSSDKDAMVSDGAPAVQLKAHSRLMGG